jgi:cyclopropane fatty-acyl-phospholipid synthase-like methyltransferase
VRPRRHLVEAQADYATNIGEGSRIAARSNIRTTAICPRRRFDKIAAVGVIEHVGIPNYPAFFGGVRRIAGRRPLSNHGIVHEFHWKATSQTEFLYRHVFERRLARTQ